MMMNPTSLPASSGIVSHDARGISVPATSQAGISNVFRVAVVIENAEKMEAAYIRTRHNNLRCFPQCGKVHKTKSFCGTPLYVRIKRLDGGQNWNVKELQVIGEFRNVRKPPAFGLMATCTSKTLDQAVFVPGHLSGSNEDMQFTINPPRKWRYRARIAQVLDMHVFTVYVVARDMVIAMKDTPQFQVIPIWKADDAMLRANDGEGVEDDEEEEAEEDANDDAEALPQPTVRTGGLNSAHKKSRASIDDDAAFPLAAKLDRLQGNSNTSAQQENPFRREHSIGSLQDLHEAAAKANALGSPGSNFATLQQSFPLMASQGLSGGGGFNSGGFPSPTSTQMFTSSFFPSFNGQQQQYSNLSRSASAGLPNGTGSPPPQVASLQNWHPMTAPGFTHPQQPSAMMDHAALFGTINNNGNGHQMPPPLPAVSATGSTTSSAPAPNRFLSNLLSNAYFGGSGFNNIMYAGGGGISPAGHHHPGQMQGTSSLAGASEQLSKAMIMQSASPTNAGGMMNGQQSVAAGGGFHSNLAGQTMNLASGKNAKEKHQD